MIFWGMKKDPILTNKPGKVLGHFGNRDFEKLRPRILDVGGSVVGLFHPFSRWGEVKD